MSPDRLGEIDRELDALGKSAGDLAGVIARARELRRAIDDVDGELEALGRGIPMTARHAREEPPTALISRAPSSMPPADEPPTALVARAPSSVPPAEVSNEPFISDVPPDVPSEPPPGGADIAGLSVDDLFADAEPTGASMAPSSGELADLFTSDAMVARPSDPELGSGLEGILEPGFTDLPPPAENEPFGELEEEHTSIVSPPVEARPRGEPTGDFELLIDDDVLQVDDDDLEAIEDEPGEEPPDDGSGGDKKRGLFSRLLGRK